MGRWGDAAEAMQERKQFLQSLRDKHLLFKQQEMQAASALNEQELTLEAEAVSGETAAPAAAKVDGGVPQWLLTMELDDSGDKAVCVKRTCITDPGNVEADVPDELAVRHVPPKGQGSPHWATATVTSKNPGGAERFRVTCAMDGRWSACGLKPKDCLSEWVFLLAQPEDGTRELAEQQHGTLKM